MSDQHDTTARPDWACLLHRPPKRVGAWVRADDSYRTCSSCLDFLRDVLRDISRQWLELDARPGNSNDHGSRGAPGFGSRSPARDDVIVMRDRRSKSYEQVDEWFDPIRLPHNVFGHDSRTNPRLADIDRPHHEQERPSRSVHNTLSSLADMVAEDRDMTPPSGDVYELVRWLDNQLDHITRQDWVRDVSEEIRGLWKQLKPVTGEPGRKRIGTCPNTVEKEDGRSTECHAPLFAPLKATDPTIRCETCGREWGYAEWRRLGDLLAS